MLSILITNPNNQTLPSILLSLVVVHFRKTKMIKQSFWNDEAQLENVLRPRNLMYIKSMSS